MTACEQSLFSGHDERLDPPVDLEFEPRTKISMREGMGVKVRKRWTCAVVVGVLCTPTGAKNNSWKMSGTMTSSGILHQ